MPHDRVSRIRRHSRCYSREMMSRLRGNSSSPIRASRSLGLPLPNPIDPLFAAGREMFRVFLGALETPPSPTLWALPLASQLGGVITRHLAVVFGFLVGQRLLGRLMACYRPGRRGAI